MAFFQKLKERLFKSSSKLEEGLDAIIEAAPAEAEAVPAAATVEARAEAVPAEDRQGLVGRILGQEKGRVLDDAMLESLEELLIQSDMGVETSLKVAANIAEGRFGRRVGARGIREVLAAEIAAILEPVARPMPIYAKRPQNLLVVGVNRGESPSRSRLPPARPAGARRRIGMGRATGSRMAAISAASTSRSRRAPTRRPKRPSAMLAATLSEVSTPMSDWISNSSRLSSMACMACLLLPEDAAHRPWLCLRRYGFGPRLDRCGRRHGFSFGGAASMIASSPSSSLDEDLKSRSLSFWKNAIPPMPLPASLLASAGDANPAR